MSLINEALKKAQHLQTRPAMPAPAAPGAAPALHQVVAKRAKPMSVKKMITVTVLVVCVFIGSLFAVGAAVYVLVAKSSPAAAPAPAKPAPAEAAPVVAAPEPAVTPVEKPAVAATTPPAAEKPAPSPLSPAKSAVTAAPATTAAPTPAATPAVSTAAGTPAATAPVADVKPAPEPAPAPHVNRPDPTILAWVNTIHVTGIRVTREGSKVLMNDKVYKTGETVNYQLDLKIVQITPDGLVFEDAQGNTYSAKF